MMHFYPPDNPLEHLTRMPFRPYWRRRLAVGSACYFCQTVVDEASFCPIPCCEAADYWAAEARKRTAQRLIEAVVRGLK